MAQLVSIVIPAFNAAPWIGKTIESALAQTWPHIEVFVVNDGSTDDTMSIARQYESERLRVITQSNAGASAARNTGLSAATGDYIQFLDADDLLATDKIERQMNLASTIGSDFALCANWSRFTSSTGDADFTPQPLCADMAPVDWVVKKFEHNAMMHPAAWLISRPLATQVGPWDESLSLDDDGEYFTRIVLASQGVRHCREATSFYRSQLLGSLSGTKSEKAWDSAYRSLAQSAQRLHLVENSPRTRHACATAFQRYIYDTYPRAPQCRRLATTQVEALGGSNVAPEGGPKFQRVRRLLGWRLAKRLQSLC
jgi:glycosyltransferase involved in cell wall biosynthesis